MHTLGSLSTAAALWLVLAALSLAPLPLGSNRPWAWSLLGLAAGSAMLLWAAGALLNRARPAVPRTVAAAAALCLGAAVWGWMQGLPGIFPPGWEHPAWRAAVEAGIEVDARIALSAEAPRDATMRLLTYFAFFALAFLLGQDSLRARRLLLAVFAITAGYAAYGMVVHIGGLPFVAPGVHRIQYARLQASFLNPNNFATYANLGILAGIGLLLDRLRGLASAGGLSRLAVTLIERLFGSRSMLPFGLLLLLVAAFLTLSRGGFLALVIGLLVVALLSFLRCRPGPRRLMLTLCAGLALAWGLLQLSGATTLARFDDIDGEAAPATGGRLAAYELALGLIDERPWLGQGFGTFEQAFLAGRDERFPVIYDKAHNTYLEHAVELGLPATLALYGAVACLVAFAVRGFFRRRRDEHYALVGAAAAAMAGAHALVDFSLQIPAVAITFATVLGVAVAQSMRTGERRRTRAETYAAAAPVPAGATVAPATA